jgi:hypothetical protein
LNLVSGTLKDNAGNNANLSLPVVGATGSLSANHQIVLDTIDPVAPSNLVDGTWMSSTTASPTITYTDGTDTGGSGILKHQLQVVLGSDTSTVLKTWADFTSSSTVTGLTLSAATQYKVQIKAIDNAGNESTVVTSDGWTVDIAGPSAPTGLILGSVPNSDITTPTLSWTAATDNGGSGVALYQVQVYNVSTGSLNAWTTSTSGSAITGGTGMLINGGTYYMKVRAVDTVGNLGSEAQSANWIATVVIICPNGYIPIPARSPYTSVSFCVAKYEMKLQYDGIIIANGNDNNAYNYDTDYENVTARSRYMAVSDLAGRPWSYIKRGENGSLTGQGAIEACQSLGNGYDLITNAQWQTIAQNTEEIPSNWTSGIVGTEMMYTGHSDNNPSNSLAVVNVNDPYDSTQGSAGAPNSSQAAGSGKEQRRTLNLSNGEVIWDLAGNVLEWVKDNDATNFGASVYIDQITSGSHTTTGTVGSLTGAAKYLFGPSGDYSSLNSSLHCGLGYGYLNNGAAGGIFRGGCFTDGGTYSGIYRVIIGQSPIIANSIYGFRCVFHP